MNWCEISLLAHHISNQGYEPLSADKSCQNRPIIRYTILVYRDELLLKSTTGIPLLSSPTPTPPPSFFCSHLFALSPRSECLEQARYGLKTWFVMMPQVVKGTETWTHSVGDNGSNKYYKPFHNKVFVCQLLNSYANLLAQVLTKFEAVFVSSSRWEPFVVFLKNIKSHIKFE